MNDGDVLPILPTFPEVRCDKCRHVYTVDTERSLIVRGNCPRCAHEAKDRRLEGRLSDSEGIEPW